MRASQCASTLVGSSTPLASKLPLSPALAAARISSLLHAPSAAPQLNHAVAAAGAAEDIDSEVEAVLRGCVQSVAMRYFIETNGPLFAELEEMQNHLWAQDEWKHSQRHKHAIVMAARQSKQAAATTHGTSAGGSGGGGSVSNARSRKSRGGKADGATDDSDTKLAALHRRMHDLNLGSLSSTGGGKGSSSGGGGSGGGGCNGGGSGSGGGGGGSAPPSRRGKCKGATK